MKLRWRIVYSALLTAYSIAVLVVLGFLYSTGDYRPEWTYLPPALAGTVLGLFLTWKRPDNRIGPLLTTLVAALVSLGASNVLMPYWLERDNSLMAVLSTLMSDAGFLMLFTTTLVLLPLWFPTGEAINRMWAWVGRVALFFTAISFVTYALADSVCASMSSSAATCVTVAIPWGIEGFDAFESPGGPPGPAIVVTLLSAIPAVVSSFVRWRRSDTIARQQIKWFLLSAIGFMIAFVLSTGIFGFDQGIIDIGYSLAFTGIFLAIALAVLKYRLYDIDRIISRTVSYALVAGLLGLLVAAVAAVAGSQFETPWVVAATTLGVAALFNPVRGRMQVWVDRRFNRSRYDAQRVMDEFAGSLRDRVDADEVVAGWLGAVDSTMQPASVGVWVRQ
jgi:hypothetical protein